MNNAHHSGLQIVPSLGPSSVPTSQQLMKEALAIALTVIVKFSNFFNYFVIYAFSLTENHDYVKFETNSHRTFINQPF